MTMQEIVKKNRSYRRYDETFVIGREILMELVDLTRYCPSGSNRQPLKYFLSCTPSTNAKIFPALSWAGHLPDWHGPKAGERPSAYIVIMGDARIAGHYFWDHGIAAQTILLGAVEAGLGGCMFASAKQELLKKSLELPEYLEILCVVCLGKPVETVVIEPLPANGDIRYWRDEAQVHHVPKRALEEIIINPT